MDFDIRNRVGSSISIRQREFAFTVRLPWIDRAPLRPRLLLDVSEGLLAMDYYDFKSHDSELSKLRSPVVNLIHADRKVWIYFSSHDYVAVSADKIPTVCKDFEDNCRRYLYGISPIMMGFQEIKVLDMIRTEIKVLILRLLQNDSCLYGGELRADQHIVEKIDLKKFVDMHKVDLAESLEPDRLEKYITKLLRGLLKEIGVPENFECACYMVENREKIFHDEAKIEKFYFFHNASQRRIVYVAYRLLRTGNSEVGDEDPEIGEEIEEERVYSMTTDLEGGDGSGNRLTKFSVSLRLPVPRDCDLYYVNPVALFSLHKDSRLFLKQMMALSVVFPEENSTMTYGAPDDHFFVLLGPIDELEILCVIQISLEGRNSQKMAFQPFRSELVWMRDDKFPSHVLPTLSGASILRIATHPSDMRLDYGSAAIELLTRYFEGQMTRLSEVETGDALKTPQVNVTETAQKYCLVEKMMRPREDLPPLLVKLCARQPERLHYLCASFELTLNCICFWKEQKFASLFIDDAPNGITGKYPCMVLKPLKNPDFEADEWGFYGPFYQVFKKTLAELFSSTYRKMNYKLAMSVLDPKIDFVKQEPPCASKKEHVDLLKHHLSDADMRRLEHYSNNLTDYSYIRDVAQKVARMYFSEQLPVPLSDVQASVLFCYGLQHKDIPEIEREMDLKKVRILDHYLKVMQKVCKYLKKVTPRVDSTASRLKLKVNIPSVGG